MAKVTLEFNLPEEETDLNMAIKASDYCYALGDYARWLRDKVKHGHIPEEAGGILDAAWDQLWDILKSYNIDDEIY